jgi:hypothetical protein
VSDTEENENLVTVYDDGDGEIRVYDRFGKFETERFPYVTRQGRLANMTAAETFAGRRAKSLKCDVKVVSRKYPRKQKVST